MLHIIIWLFGRARVLFRQVRRARNFPAPLRKDCIFVAPNGHRFDKWKPVSDRNFLGEILILVDGECPCFRNSVTTSLFTAKTLLQMKVHWLMVFWTVWLGKNVQGAIITVREVPVGRMAILPCPSSDDNYMFMYWQLKDDEGIIGPGNAMDESKYDYEVLTGKLYIRVRFELLVIERKDF